MRAVRVVVGLAIGRIISLAISRAVLIREEVIIKFSDLLL